MRYTQTILLYLAGFILCLHTLVPHNHHGEVATNDMVSYTNADSVLDWVKIMFLVDQGEGHLDHFENGNDNLNVSHFTVVYTPLGLHTSKLIPLDGKSVNRENTFIISSAPPDSYLKKVIGLRGPPICNIG